MEENRFQSQPWAQWLNTHPLLADIAGQKDVFWSNSYRVSTELALSQIALSMDDITQASDRLSRFAPYMAKVFPDTVKTAGIIESELVAIDRMQARLTDIYGCDLPGRLFLKCDSHLPIAGSVKARGGIYEVIKYAESIAISAGLLRESDNYERLDATDCRALFQEYSIVVGSTGNLGLSIGIMSARLGFKVSVHMSADARQWKKDLLRSKGVNVIEYEEDYSIAVEQGRMEAERTAKCHFVDDENSEDLFLGYSVAALRLAQQLQQQDITVDEQHPLFVYLPCGVGGAPGGIAFGLKMLFSDHVHCFFAEPVASPCMLLGIYTQLQQAICVQDVGLDGMTCADGLAVGRASAFVGQVVQPLLSGLYTVQDDDLYRMLAQLKDTEQWQLEPSALAGLSGLPKLITQGGGYIEKNGLAPYMENATHIAWATGGSMVPEEEWASYYEKGQLLNSVA